MTSPNIESHEIAVLDLCVRNRPRIPSLEVTRQIINNNNNDDDDDINIKKRKSYAVDSDSSQDSILNTMYTKSLWMGCSSTSNSTSNNNSNSNTAVSKTKTRPFKAYSMPKDPFLIGGIVGCDDMLFSNTTSDTYSEFRRRMLEQVHAVNPTPGVTNIKMRRTHHTDSQSMNSNGAVSTTAHDKDVSYWEKRKKNNEAAKRSRDARRAKEDEIAIRAAFLEQENLKLKYEIATLRNEMARLRCLLYN